MNEKIVIHSKIIKCIVLWDRYPRCLMCRFWPGGPRIARPECGGHTLCRCWPGPLVSAVMWRLPGSRVTGRLTLQARLLRPLSAEGAGGPWRSWLR
jgi:hypothetical protein